MTRNDALKEAISEIKNRVNSEKELREAKIQKAIADNPEIFAVSNELMRQGADFAMFALSESKDKVDTKIEKMEELSRKKAELLKKAGVNEVEFLCKKCEDTGYVNGKLCDCAKELAQKIYVEEFKKTAPIDRCRFDNFKLSYYGEGDAKTRMSGIFDYCRKYVNEFDKNVSPSVIFMGKTGVGKTHLSLAIAGEIIKKGFSVTYSPAHNLFLKIEKEHFDTHQNDTYDDAVNCDLLVIDDLGSEFASSFVQTMIYNIINTRILASKPIIISTNLTIEEINDRFSPRVASRIIGDYDAKIFLGPDIRQLKKIEKK